MAHPIVVVAPELVIGPVVRQEDLCPLRRDREKISSVKWRGRNNTKLAKPQSGGIAQAPPPQVLGNAEGTTSTSQLLEIIRRPWRPATCFRLGRQGEGSWDSRTDLALFFELIVSSLARVRGGQVRTVRRDVNHLIPRRVLPSPAPSEEITVRGKHCTERASGFRAHCSRRQAAGVCALQV